MAIIKAQIIPPGYTDIVHPETEASMVLMADGSTVESKVTTHLADVATETVQGHVKVDGTTIRIKNGIISAMVNTDTYYSEGDEGSNITGGWVNGYVVRDGVTTKNVDHLYLRATNGGSTSLGAEIACVTNVQIDLSNIRTLRINWENIGMVASGLSSDINVSTNKAGSAIDRNAGLTVTNGAFTRRSDFVDVSALSGLYYVRIHAVASNIAVSKETNLKVYDIWGE